MKISLIKQTLYGLGLVSASIFASESEMTDTQPTLSYQNASQYSHILWPSGLEQKPIKVLPLINYSGIPIGAREEPVNYYQHGKLPVFINQLTLDSIAATRQLMPVGQQGEYTIQFSLDQLRLPYQYAPDDKWWEALHGQVDRAFIEPRNTKIALSVYLSSGQRPLKKWMETVSMQFNHCDLNEQPQPASILANNNRSILDYKRSVPGQAFLAATNYLLTKVIARLNQQPYLAKVERKWGENLYLRSDSASFVVGDYLNVYYQTPGGGQNDLPAGQVEVIQSNQQHALAYPVDLRGDHLKAGDWVEVSSAAQPFPAKFYYRANSDCAAVVEAI